MLTELFSSFLEILSLTSLLLIEIVLGSHNSRNFGHSSARSVPSAVRSAERVAWIVPVTYNRIYLRSRHLYGRRAVWSWRMAYVRDDVAVI